MSAHPLSEWEGWSEVPGDAVPLVWTSHVLTRYAERLAGSQEGRPEATVALALSRMLAAARIVRERPTWIRGEENQAVAWLILGDDVAVPLGANRDGELVALTLMARGEYAPVHRANLNSNRRRRADAKRRSRTEGKRGRESRKSRLALIRDVHEREAS